MSMCLNLLLQAGKAGRGGEKGRCHIKEARFKFITGLSGIMDSEVSKLFPAALLSSCTAVEKGRKVRLGQGGPQGDILFASSYFWK